MMIIVAVYGGSTLASSTWCVLLFFLLFFSIRIWIFSYRFCAVVFAHRAYSIIAHFSIRGTRTFVSTQLAILDTLGKWELYWINRRRMHFSLVNAYRRRISPYCQYLCCNLCVCVCIVRCVSVLMRAKSDIISQKSKIMANHNIKIRTNGSNVNVTVSFFFIPLCIVYSFLWLYFSYSPKNVSIVMKKERRWKKNTK